MSEAARSTHVGKEEAPLLRRICPEFPLDRSWCALVDEVPEAISA
jgi:hypothetical protein